MDRVLITGAGGFLGSHLVSESPLNADLYGLTQTSKVNLKGDQWFRSPITEKEALFRTLDRIDPNCIIHTAALSGESACRADEEMARKINVESCQFIRDWCEEHDAHLIFTSSDLVFGGSHAPYAEADATGGNMLYGQLKAEAEDVIRSYANALILRLPLLYGFGLGDRKGILNQFIENCETGKEQGLFTDEFRTPASVLDIADYIWQLVQRRTTGLLHLGGKQRLSRWEIGQLFIGHFQLPNSHLKPIERAEIGMGFRPEDASLISDKAYALGFDPASIEDGLREMAAQYSGTPH